MATTGTSQIPAGVSAFYDRNLLERAVPSFIHDLFGQMRNIPKGNSDTIKFRKYSALTAATTALTEGVTPTGSQLSVTDSTATLSQYGDYVTLTDIVQTDVEDNVIKEATDVLGEQAGDTYDQVWRDVLVAGTSVRYANGVANRASVAASIATADLDSAIKTLRGNDAKMFREAIEGTNKINTYPIAAAYGAICHTDTAEKIEALTGVKKVHEYAGMKVIHPSEFASYRYIRFLATTNAKVFTGAGSSSADVYATLVFGKDAYGVVSPRGQRGFETIVKPLGSGDDALNQRSTVGWKGRTVAKILNDSFMVRIESADA